jgi:hypothetical protein
MLSPSELAHALTAQPFEYSNKHQIVAAAQSADSVDQFVPLLHALLERAVSRQCS